MFETVRQQIVMSGLVMEPDEKLEITLPDETKLILRVVSASPPSDDGSVTYTVVPWDGGVEYELADFDPTTGHLHTCMAEGDPEAGCMHECAGHLYAIAEDAEKRASE